MYKLWFNFILGSNFIFLSFKLIIIYYQTKNKGKWNLNQGQNRTATYTLNGKFLPLNETSLFLPGEGEVNFLNLLATDHFALQMWVNGPGRNYVSWDHW